MRVATFEHAMRNTTAAADSIRRRMVRAGASFFFQAEDGIRDGRVTGVQTCALPICEHIPDSRFTPYHDIDSLPAGIDADAPRSEERRVGKEWRSRRARDH